MKTSNLQRIVLAVETLTDELYEIDHDWKRSAKMKRSVMVSIGPYSEISKEERRNLDSQHCILSPKKKKKSQPETSSEK
jgi:hypothetical protein